MSSLPYATYRFQFHRGFTLARATELVPYLHELGVSHVYASPLLKARPGSTHGYDVCDASLLNPEIGADTDLENFVRALRDRDMGLVLDIVPNHMGIGARDNPWWWDVLRHGRASKFADYFDIDWNSPVQGLRGKLLVPVLGDEYQRALERGEIKVVCQDAEVTVRYFEHQFPVCPESILAQEKSLEETVREVNADIRALERFLDQQHYRLAFWRRGDTELNYRRFFSITSLAGVRVELPQVFVDTHNRILDWRQRDLLDGLRIDHPDGLRDPQRYLERLHEAASAPWIVVEKILEPGESLPATWPVAGTIGYEFLNRLGGLFIDARAERALTDFYAEFTGEPLDYEAIVLERKRVVLGHILAAEVERLLRLLLPLSQEDSRCRGVDENELRQALIELAACFPVYRTYVRAETGKVSEEDILRVEQTVEKAKAQQPGLAILFEFLADVLLLKIHSGGAGEFVMRFQQLTGPAMAKGVEDTAFYCFNRFVALNEVGGDPSHFGLSVREFHSTCEQAQAHWPHGMLATSTHDTKRSEDVRSRLAVLSEIPEEWRAAVRRWSAMNEQHRGDGMPSRNAEYLFYQNLVGAWPLEAGRAAAYMEKAAREGRQQTTWTEPNAEYEAALGRFVERALATPEFVAHVEAFVSRLREYGQINSLAQTLIKLTAPGVPDIYQGTELWDLSLVDPDNRRPVDFNGRRALLRELSSISAELAWERRDEGVPKMWLIQKALGLRRRHPECFGAESSYTPVFAEGAAAEHIVAFARRERVLTVVPRLSARLGANWGDTSLTLAEGNWLNALTGDPLSGGRRRVADLFKSFPVALLHFQTVPKQGQSGLRGPSISALECAPEEMI